MKKLLAFLLAVSMTATSVSVAAADTVTDSTVSLSARERLENGLSVYERELGYQNSVPLASLDETTELWDEYIALFNEQYYNAIESDRAMKELLQLALEQNADNATDDTESGESSGADSGSAGDSEESSEESDSTVEDDESPSMVLRSLVADEFYNAVKEAMPPDEFERLTAHPSKYSLYYIDGKVIILTRVLHTAGAIQDCYEFFMHVFSLNIFGIIEGEMSWWGVTDACKKLYNVYFLVNERNRELLEIEREMTELGLWNVLDEEIEIPEKSSLPPSETTSGNGTEESERGDAEERDGVLVGNDVTKDDWVTWFNSLPTLIYNLGSGNDTYKITESDEPVFAIISEAGNGEAGNDTLLLDYDTSMENLEFLRNDGDLYINDTVNDVHIIITENFANDKKRVETIRLRNGDELDYDDICNIVDSFIGTEEDDVINGYPEVNHIWGNGGNDTIYGQKNTSYMLGGAGDDTLTLADGCFDSFYSSTIFGDYAYGMDGNDLIILGAGDDFIYGGKGDDIIKSDHGDDVFYYELGDGNDTVDDTRGRYTYPYEGHDVLFFGEGILPEEVNVTLSSDTETFYLHFTKTGDTITMPGNYISGVTPVFPIEEICFADGTVWNRDNLLDRARFIYGTEEDDSLECYQKSDATFWGYSGNDRLIGNEGNDIFYGGKGDDYLRGGDGDDIFYYELGDGNDTIDMGNGKNRYPQSGYNILCLGKGISPERVIVERTSDKYAYILRIANTNETITITGNVISGVTNYFPIKEIRFDNGTVWKLADLEENYTKWLGCDYIDLLCTTPENLRMTSHSDSTITLSWDAVDGADGYTVEQLINGKWQRISKLSRTKLTVSNLSSATEYSFRVRAYAMINGKGEFSPAAVTDVITKPSKTTGKMTAHTTNSVTLTWDTVEGAEGYIIEVYKNGAWQRASKLVGGAKYQYRLTGLESGTLYEFRIKSYKFLGNKAYFSVVSDTIKAMSKPAKTVGSVVTTTTDSATLSWETVQGADGYVIEVYVGGGVWERAANVTGTATSQYRLTGLTSKTTYKYRIKAYKFLGIKEYFATGCDTISARTK